MNNLVNLLYELFLIELNKLSNLPPYTEKKMLLNKKHFFPKACILIINKNILQNQ